MIRETITVYAVQENGTLRRVAGYDRETALRVINDPTVKTITRAVNLIAFDSTGRAIAQTGEPQPSSKTAEEPSKLCVCERCLMAIESREGQQITRKIYLDDDDPRPCDWCEESDFDTLYEIQ